LDLRRQRDLHAQPRRAGTRQDRPPQHLDRHVHGVFAQLLLLGRLPVRDHVQPGRRPALDDGARRRDHRHVRLLKGGAGEGAAARPRAFALYDPRAAVGRVLLSIVIGACTGFLWTQRYGWATRAVVGWDAGAIALLSMVWFVIFGVDPLETRCRAATADPGRTTVWILVLGASSSSLFAAAGLMRHARV